jgi:hypothetical protein
LNSYTRITNVFEDKWQDQRGTRPRVLDAAVKLGQNHAWDDSLFPFYFAKFLAFLKP